MLEGSVNGRTLHDLDLVPNPTLGRRSPGPGQPNLGVIIISTLTHLRSRFCVSFHLPTLTCTYRLETQNTHAILPARYSEFGQVIMCSADVFLGLLALLFPPLPGESRALLPLKLGPPLPPSSSSLFGGTRCLVDAGPPAAAGLIANHVCSHSMGEVRHLLRRLRHQHPALCSGLRQYPPEPPVGIRILTHVLTTPPRFQVPGLLHAWYIIAKFPEPNYYDYERVDESERGGRVAHVVLHEDGQGRRTARPAGGRGQQPKPPAQQSNMTYGTNGRDSAAAAPPQQPHYPDAAAGPSDGAPPPSYAQVVAGDNKIQDQS